MKQLYTLILMLPAMLFAQTDIDFQSLSSGLPGTSWTWTADVENTSFAVVDNPDATGINTSSKVGELTAAAGSNAWALAFSDGIGSFSFDATNTTVKIMVYKTRISPVEIKFEDASNSDINVSRTVSNTAINAWEELTFDFYNSISSIPYDKIVIIPDNSARTVDNVTYFDNITFTTGVAPPMPSVAATTPTEASSNVISIFSDAYDNVVADFSPVWDTAEVSDITIDGDAVKKYYNMTTAGIDFTAQDVSSLGSIKIDYWTEGAAFLKVKLVDYKEDGVWGPADTDPNYEKEITHNIENFSIWNTITINLAEFNLPVGKVGQILLTSDNTKNIYVDNIYFSSTTITVVEDPDPEPTISATPPPSREAENVKSILSPNYTDHQFDEYQPTWGIGTLTEFFINDDKMWKVDGFEKFAVADYSAPLFNIDNMEKFHVDIWTEGELSAGDKIKLQLVSNAGAAAGNDIIIEEIATVAGGSTWQTVEFDLTAVKGDKDWSEIIQVILMLSSTKHEVYYFDNMYFSKEPGQGPDVSLSDLAIDGESLSGFNGSKTDYSVPLIVGTTTVPQITSATTTDTNATSVVTQATSIPGDATVVVTAADGTTTETYTVSFFIGIPAGAPTTPTVAAADVISVYSDAYTDIATDYNPGWGQAGTVNTTFDPGDGNNVMLYSNFNYQGTILPETDLTSTNFLHIDIWVAENETRAIKVSLIGGGETFVLVPTTPGSWNSVDIPLTSFSGNNLSAIIQMKFDGQFASDGAAADTAIRSDIYLDNIYFYNDGSTDTGGGGDTTTYCETEVTHLNIDNHAGSIILTIENSGDDSITVTATSKDDVIDLLEISGIQGGGTTTGATIANGVATAEIIWGVGTMPATTTFQLMWSDESSPGNQMLNAGTGTDALGNIDTSNVCGTAGINEVNGFSVVTYPNPVENTLNVSAGDVVDSVTIFDLTGREVLRATPNAAAFSLDVSNLNKGLYLVTVKAGEQELNTKLVK